jgi:hypothetical protein
MANVGRSPQSQGRAAIFFRFHAGIGMREPFAR